MEQTTLKRQREEEEETTEEAVVVVKRQKSYEDILCILEKDEEDPHHDFSSIITTLHQEEEEEEEEEEESHPQIDPSEDERERVMKHLLEASDDELGIPNTEVGEEFEGCQGVVSVEEIDGGDLLLLPVGGGVFGDGLLWEIEDEAANYYTLLQSELFM